MLEIGTSGLMSGEEKRVIIRLISAADTALLLDSTQWGRQSGERRERKNEPIRAVKWRRQMQWPGFQ